MSEDIIVSNGASITPFSTLVNYEVANGDTVSDYWLESGSSLTILSGGSAAQIQIGDGSEEYVSAGGVDTSAIVMGGGTQYIDGGTVNDAYVGWGSDSNWFAADYEKYVVTTGGEDVYDTLYRTYLYPPAEQYVMSGGVVNGGVLSASTGSTAVGGGMTTVGYEQSQVITFVPKANQYVSNGGFVNNISLQGSNVSQAIYSGGLASSTSILDGAEQYVYSGGIVSNTDVSGGGQILSVGASANNTVIYNGYAEVNSGAVATVVAIEGGSLIASRGAIVSNITIYSGYAEVNSGAVVTGVEIDGGSLIVNGNVDTGSIAFSKGVIAINSGGTVTGSVSLVSNTSIYISSAGAFDGNVTVNSKGYLYLQNTALLQGDVTLNPGGSMTIGVSNGGSVDLIGDNNRGLIINGYKSGVDNAVTTAISGFSGVGVNSSDKVTIDNLRVADISSVTYPDDNHITLQLLDGTSFTLNMIGIKQTGYTLGSDIYGNLTMVVCFLSGTMIKMSKGACAVEDLQVGDTILTYDPQTKAKVKKKITWVGKQTTRVDVNLPDDLAGYPVRILKDAFKKNVPNKDLLITSEHCLFIDGYFVPARMLVNGRSIFYDYSITSYDYYHFETEDHSVIWADGMLTESYLNTGNRHAFNKDQKVVQLDPHVKIWAEDAVAPLMVERDFVEPIFNDLVKRADKQKLINHNEKGYVLSNDPDLYLLTEDGEEIYQSRVDQDQVIFTLPANTQNVYLVSRKSRPCDVIGPFVDDRRALGILVGKVCVLNEYGAYPMVNYLKEEALQGWSVVEQSNCRWTMGCVLLPLDVYNVDDAFELSIQIISAGPYFIKKEIDEEEEERLAV